jgi:hypothetical protein
MLRNNYRIKIDGEWTLDNLYEFPRTYSQLYSLLYVLELASSELGDDSKEDLSDYRVESAFRSHPWRGGFSAVNFYQQLGYIVPNRDRPKIKSIRYESPGWLELTLAVAVASNIERLVTAFTKSGKHLNSLYKEIYKGLHDRRLMRIKVKRQEIALKRDQLRFVEESARSLSRGLGFKNLDELNMLTQNPLGTLKILLSLYRRLRTLSKYESKGKADL